MLDEARAFIRDGATNARDLVGQSGLSTPEAS